MGAKGIRATAREKAAWVAEVLKPGNTFRAVSEREGAPSVSALQKWKANKTTREAAEALLSGAPRPPGLSSSGGAALVKMVKWVRIATAPGADIQTIARLPGAPKAQTLELWCGRPDVLAEIELTKGGEIEPAPPAPPLGEPPPSRGRPTKKNDPAIRAELIRGLRLGMGYDRCAHLAGIHPTSVKNWIRDALMSTDGSAVGAQLLKAEAQGIAEMHERILEGEHGWQGSAWVLERRKGYTTKIEATVEITNPVEALTNAELDTIISARVED